METGATTTRGQAQIEIMQEVLEVFGHDLKNPLQTIFLLTQLALDDAPAGSEEEDRCRRTLEAAERMGSIVNGLAGLTGTVQGPRTTKATIDAFVELFARRWERHSVSMDIDLGPTALVRAPEHMDTAMINAGLALVAAVTERRGQFRLEVRGETSGDGPGAEFAVRLTLRDVDDASAVVPSPRHVARFERLLAGAGDALRVTLDDSTIRLAYGCGVR